MYSEVLKQIPSCLRYFSKRQSSFSQRPSTYSGYHVGVGDSRGQSTQGSMTSLHSSKHRTRRFLLIAVLLAGIGGHLVWSAHVSAEMSSRQAQIAAAALTAQKAQKLNDQIAALLLANPGITLSISTISQVNGLQHYGSSAPFDGASVGKLLTAADFLHHVESHTASLQQIIAGQTAEALLQQMIVNSDDAAWTSLNDFLTHTDLGRFADSQGIRGYDPDTNTFDSNDIALLLEKLYDRQLLNAADRSLLLSYMAQANYRIFIVAGTPTGDTVYHKVGEDDDDVHDAAIITNGQHYVILVIFTDGNGVYDWGARAQLMQTVAREVSAAYL